MHPRLTYTLAEQHIAELRRAANHRRLAHAAVTASSSSHAAPAPVPFRRWLRRRLAY
jgi:hypothetical protein